MSKPLKEPEKPSLMMALLNSDIVQFLSSNVYDLYPLFSPTFTHPFPYI